MEGVDPVWLVTWSFLAGIFVAYATAFLLVVLIFRK